MEKEVQTTVTPNPPSGEKSILEEKRKEEIKELMVRCPSILQITTLCYKETESHPVKPTVRCLYDIKIKNLVKEVLIKDWKLSSPRIVVVMISNIGSIHNWMNQKQIKSLQKGLMKAAENTNMWLIANGIDMGPTSVIGDAVSEYIAETKYKRTTNREKPFSKFNFIGVADEDMVKYLTTITSSDELKVEIPTDGSHGDNKYRLNQNLSHYIIIKDKSDDKNGVNTFLENLTKFLSFSENEAISAGVPTNESSSIETNEIPVVSLVIRGGYGCARLVLQQIKNQLPIVVLKGTGGLADLLGFVELEMSDRSLDFWDMEFVDLHLKPELMHRINTMFPQYRTSLELVYDFRDVVLECVQVSRSREGQMFMTVINIYDTYTCNLENMTEVLLSALFKSQQTAADILQIGSVTSSKINAEIKRDLNLCVDWNCPEVAKKEVLTKDPTFMLNEEKALFEEALIRKNRCDFIDLFLGNKFRLRTFLTPKRIKRMFRKIHSHEFFSTVCWEGILGRTQDKKQSQRFIDRELNWLVEACTGNSGFFDEAELNYFVTGQYPDSEREAERKSLEIIVLWGILHFRKRLVRILWRHSDRPISLALVIAMSYERLSWYVSEQSLNDELKTESKQFVIFALKVLDKCYKESAVRSENVLNEAPKDWNFKTAVDLAAFGRFREFFSHPSCQRWLTNKFSGNIAVKELRQQWIRLPTLIKLLMSTYLVFPSFWWIRVTNVPLTVSEEDVDDEDEEGEHKKKDSKDLLTTDISVHKTGSKTNVSKEKVKDKQSELAGEDGKPSLSSSIDSSPSSSFDESKPKEEEQKKPNLMRSDDNTVNKPTKTITTSSPPVWTVMYEVWTAPITKFWNFQFFYTFYLGIFCVALLYPRCGNYYLDLIIAIWTGLLIVDDLRQTYILNYTNSNVSIPWRLFEVVLKSTFFVLFSFSRVIEKIVYDNRSGLGKRPEEPLLSAYQEKVIMSLALMQAFHALLSKFLPISATLGPLLYRLKIMLMVDFLNFIRLSILVMISFGVILQAILYPDQDLNGELFRRAFHRAFFSLFLTPADELIVDPNCETMRHTVNTTGEKADCSASIYYDQGCRVTGFWPYVFMIAYFIMLKLILLTLLFALFASSASTLTADTDAIWKFQRYGLVLDFVSRGPLPPPLNIFYYGFLTGEWLYYSLKDLKQKALKKPTFKVSDFTLFTVYAARPQTRVLADDEYNYFRLLASETFEEFQNKQDSDTISTLQWERIQSLSKETEFQRQSIRQMKGKVTEIDRYLKANLPKKDDKKSH